jgi:hypothetical protein
MPQHKKKKKPSLNRTVEKLARIAEQHLAGLPDEEQETRVDALARRTFSSRRDTPSMPSKSERTRQNRVAGRGR